MTEINFYVSSSTNKDSIYKLLPPLLDKILQQKNKVIITCNSDQEIKRLDDFLWSYKSESFLPHGIQGEEHSSQQPILITKEDGNINMSNVLICLSGAKASDFSSYLKVFDIFEGSDEQKQMGRKRWAEYKEKGYDLSYFTSENGKWTKKM